MPFPLIPFAAGALVGAYVGDKITGGTTDAANAVGSASSGVLKLALLGGVAYVGFELYKRGAFK